VIAVGSTSNLPGGGSSDINSTSTQIQIAGVTDPIENTTYVQNVDDTFIETMNMSVLHGRNFERNLASDSSTILINESMLKRLNINDPETVLN